MADYRLNVRNATGDVVADGVLTSEEFRALREQYIYRSGDASFAPGELVELKSGSLPLTVLDFCDGCGEVEVAYTDSDGDIEIFTFPAAALKPFVEEEGE